ncbi:MAG: hypothetical protein OQL06_14725 [Gammaproteobacteria bacterium]|nr:hypothetical protein [Gammaproteobacteria bacterium]
MDLLPDEIMQDILHQGTGRGGNHHFRSGELITGWNPDLLKTLPLQNYSGRLHKVVLTG